LRTIDCGDSEFGDAADDLTDIWNHGPCGQLVTTVGGEILRANATLETLLNYPEPLRGKQFDALLAVGARIHYETHFAPLLRMSGELSGVTLELVAHDGTRLPMFVTANTKFDDAGHPVLLRISVQDAGERRSYERELLAERRLADAERSRAEALADTLRRALLPPALTPPSGLDAAAHYHAASADITGDFYDLFPLSSTRSGFFIGDVCGKGVDAAIITSLTRYTLRSAAVREHSPIAMLHTLDTVLAQERNMGPIRFCTVIMGVITARDDGYDVEMASGGHPAPVLLKRDGTASYLNTTGGQAVGLTSSPHFVSTTVRLDAGDVLLLYTDGLTEASVGSGTARYDDEGALLRFAQNHGPSTAAGAVTAVKALLDGFGAGLQDDAAVLALGVPAKVLLPFQSPMP
jgi:phosphoserine phosphatase RsbU/P